MTAPQSEQGPTPPRPQPADVGRAIAEALVTGGSPDALRGIVCDYVRTLKRDGLPPEQALRRAKEMVGVSTVTTIPGRGPLPSDRLAAEVIEWFLAEYYRAD